MITFTVRGIDPLDLEDTELVLKPNNTDGHTDVASDMLVASLLDVVRDQQHVGATSPHRLRHEPQTPR